MMVEDFVVPNTIAVQSHAALGAELTSLPMLAEALHYCRQRNIEFTPVGQGSNVIPMTRVASFVGVIGIRGIEVLKQTDTEVDIRVGAGEPWHPFVQHCLRQGWYGLENLSLIPGTVGAAPIQNIGAYGVDVSSFIAAVEVLDAAGERRVINADQCQFAYRTSLFRNSKAFTVTHVCFRLPLVAEVVISYPGVSETLEQMGCSSPRPLDVAQAVINVRRLKLPDPAQHPNAGSVFKNPIVSLQTATELAKRLPNLQRFDVPEDPRKVKLSAAQLIDQLGWKEKGTAQIGCWQLQPLVVVNRGAECGEDILAFAHAIQLDVQESLGIELELEPIIL